MKVVGKLKQRSPEKTAKNGSKYVTLIVENVFLFCWNVDDIEGLKEGDECEVEYKENGNFKILQKISWQKYTPKEIANREAILKYLEETRTYDELTAFVGGDESIIKDLLAQGEILQTSPDKFVVLR